MKILKMLNLIFEQNNRIIACTDLLVGIDKSDTDKVLKGLNKERDKIFEIE